MLNGGTDIVQRHALTIPQAKVAYAYKKEEKNRHKKIIKLIQ